MEASKTPFTLSTDISQDDCMVMAAQAHEAFLPDIQTRLKNINMPPSPISDTHIRNWLSHTETCSVIKAVSRETSEIMGSICWVHRGYIPRDPQPERTAGRFTEISEGSNKTKIQQLEDLTDSHFEQFMTDIMPEGTKCWFIAGLVVAPQYQGMGVGRALVEWGTSRAEKDGVFAWVHSSEMAWKAYEAYCFTVVRELRLDLDKYAEDQAVGHGPEKGGKWGTYTFKYMVYAPERAIGFLEK